MHALRLAARLELHMRVFALPQTPFAFLLRMRARKCGYPIAHSNPFAVISGDSLSPSIPLCLQIFRPPATLSWKFVPPILMLGLHDRMCNCPVGEITEFDHGITALVS